MTREDAIERVKSTIFGSFIGVGISESTDEYTGEVFISVDDEKVYYSEPFKDLAARLETGFLWPAGIFDVYFIASENKSHADITKRSGNSFTDGLIVNTVPASTLLWTSAAPVHPPIMMPLVNLDIGMQRPYLSQIVTKEFNIPFGVPLGHIVPLTVSVWNVSGIFLETMPIQQVAASSVVVKVDDNFVRNLDAENVNPRTESEADETYAWAA
jgi:hypothetical protein